MQMALFAKIPIFVIGLVVVAIGTSLPEFVFSLRSLEEHQPSMFFGNLLGSTIANSTLIIGATSLIHPVTVVAVDQYFMAAMAFILVFGCFWYFIRTKHRLDRWEALLLLLLYVTFLVVEFI
jgi:cation:H+ antiporter